MLSGKDADGFSAIALAIFTRRSVRRRSPNSAVPNVSTAHFSGCSSPAMSICFAPFVYIASPSSLPEFVLTCQSCKQGGHIILIDPIECSSQRVIVEHVCCDPLSQQMLNWFVRKELRDQIEL